MKPPSLLSTTSFKLSALYLGLFLCSFLAIGITVYLLAVHALEEQLKSNIDSELTWLKAEYDNGGLPELISEIKEIIGSKSRVAEEYGVIDQTGQLLAGNLGHFEPTEGWQTVQRHLLKSKTASSPEFLITRVTALPGQLWLAVGHDNGYIEAAGTAIIEAFLWGFVLVLLLGTASGFYISRTFLKKVAGITQSAQAIIAGDLSHRLAVTENRDELDNLAHLLNRMLDKIGALVANVQQVSNDIAHDLRTPVSHLKFRLEDALKNPLSEAQYQEQIALAIAEVDTILETFSALLRIAQIESKSRRSGFKIVNFSELVTSVIEALSLVAEEQGKTLISDVEQNELLIGDKELLTQLVFNLLENAIVHTPKYSQISVSLKSNNYRIELTVADNGLGITEAYRQKVFQRFYRLEQSRTTAGNGLGLSIVAAIVDLHEGCITLADNNPGLKVIVAFSGDSQ